MCLGKQKKPRIQVSRRLQALDQPEVADPTSAPHARVYQLALSMRRNFGIKLTLNSRVFRDSRQVDLRTAAEQDAAAPDAEKVRGTRCVILRMPVIVLKSLPSVGLFCWPGLKGEHASNMRRLMMPVIATGAFLAVAARCVRMC